MDTRSFLLLVLCFCTIHCSVNSTSVKKEVSSAYLELATNMIIKAKDNIPSDFDCEHCGKNCPVCPKLKDCSTINAADCADVFNMGNDKSGVYEIWPRNRLVDKESVTVYCDMETDGGGWTVIQRRGDFGSLEDYFYKDWKSYKEGFGDKEKDFWLGNDYIFFMTNQKLYSVRFDLMDVDKNRTYALYDKFWIEDEEHNYTLHIANYSGDAGDAMSDYNDVAFSTKDRDNDIFSGNCAVSKKGGWWYKRCTTANLNGLYHKGFYAGRWDGVYWQPWRGLLNNLEWTEIKLRPMSFSD